MAHLLLHDTALSQFPGSREGMAIKEGARDWKVEPFERTERPLSPAGDILPQRLSLTPFTRAWVRFHLGLLASRSDCWWILFKMRPEERSGEKWSKAETQEGSESESGERSFHLSRVPAARASWTSNIVPEWQLSKAGPFQMLPRGTETDVLGKSRKILGEEKGLDWQSLKVKGE